ncbi:hypothetical protein [Vibrio coralliilyticus]|uniref:hypothetical protein n=1 Tax=Vibrio coralliilyticus TaxID=190893 RepID=UPI0012DB0A2F|nr:hypothetical protein [Vibrio coralliilyticus]
MARYNVVVAELAEREVMLMTQVVIAQAERSLSSEVRGLRTGHSGDALPSLMTNK